MLKKIFIVFVILFCLQGFSADIQGALDEISSTSLLKRSAAKEQSILDLEAEIKSNLLKNAFEGKIRAENKILLAIEKDKNCLEIKDKLLQLDGFFDSIKAGEADVVLSFLIQNTNYSASKLFISKQVFASKNEKVFFALSNYSVSDRAPVGVDSKDTDTFLYLIYTPISESGLASSLYLSVLLSNTEGGSILGISNMRPVLQAVKKTKEQATQLSQKEKEQDMTSDTSKTSKAKMSEQQKALARMQAEKEKAEARMQAEKGRGTGRVQTEKEKLDLNLKAEGELKCKAIAEIVLKYNSQIEILRNREFQIRNLIKSVPSLAYKQNSELSALASYKAMLELCAEKYEYLGSIEKNQVDLKINSTKSSESRLEYLEREKVSLKTQIKSLKISIERYRIEYEKAKKIASMSSKP